MNRPDDWALIVCWILTTIGWFCLGALFGMRKTSFWRTEWIKLEHDTARELRREPGRSTS